MRPTSSPTNSWSPIVELRQYTIRPGHRDAFADLFDSVFVESQEQVGMRIIGQFRDLGDPTRFVWLRGFDDMETRAARLEGFYTGPVWRAHGRTANAMMVDCDDVLLLRPARADSGFAAVDPSRRGGEVPRDGGLVEVTVVHLDEARDEGRVLELFERTVPAIVESGRRVLAYFVTEPRANTFPALPVREGELVFVSFVGSPERAAAGATDAFARAATRALSPSRRPQMLRLAPTRRSLLHGHAPACEAALRSSRAEEQTTAER